MIAGTVVGQNGIMSKVAAGRRQSIHTNMKPNIHSEVLPGIFCMARLTKQHTASSTNDYGADVVATLAREEVVAA